MPPSAQIKSWGSLRTFTLWLQDAEMITCFVHLAAAISALNNPKLEKVHTLGLLYVLSFCG